MRTHASSVEADPHVEAINRKAHDDYLAATRAAQRLAIQQRDADKRRALETHYGAYDRVWRSRVDHSIAARKQAERDEEEVRQRLDFAERRSLDAFGRKMISSREGAPDLSPSPSPEHPRPFLGTKRPMSVASTRDGRISPLALHSSVSTSSLMSNYSPPPVRCRDRSAVLTRDCWS